MQSLHIQHVCKFNGGAEQCRYLLYGAKGFECLKLIETKKVYRDALVAEEKMIARGDNCEGRNY